MGYRRMQLLAEAIKKANSTDSDKVAKALLGLTIDTPIGKQTISAKNHQANRGQFWGKMVKDPKYPFAIMKDPEYIDPTPFMKSSMPAVACATPHLTPPGRAQATPSTPAAARRRQAALGAMDADVLFLFGQFLGGLTAAMFLFLIASGLSLIFGVLRVLNFAHGSFYMIGAYLAWQFVQWLRPAPGGGSGSPRSARRSASRCSAASSSGCCSAISTAARSSTSCCSPTRWC